jgi:ankyrin repeat protein
MDVELYKIYKKIKTQDAWSNYLIYDSFLETNNYNGGMYAACIKGDTEVIQLFIDYGATNIDRGMAYACEVNNINIVKFMITQGANDWNFGMCSACHGGHIELIEFMITCMVTSVPQITPNWNNAIFCASTGGHIELIKLIINKNRDAAVPTELNWNVILVNALKHEHYKITELMIKCGATNINLLENTTDLNLYKIYCLSYYNVYRKHRKTKEKLQELIIKQCPLYEFLKNKGNTKSFKYFPNELIRAIKQFI